jgi:hypothetical protein
VWGDFFQVGIQTHTEERFLTANVVNDFLLSHIIRFLGDSLFTTHPTVRSGVRAKTYYIYILSAKIVFFQHLAVRCLIKMFTFVHGFLGKELRRIAFS